MPKMTRKVIQCVEVEWSLDDLRSKLDYRDDSGVTRSLDPDATFRFINDENPRLVASWQADVRTKAAEGVLSNTQKAVYEVIRTAENRGGITDKRISAMIPSLTIHSIHKARHVLLQSGYIKGIGRQGKETLWVTA